MLLAARARERRRRRRRPHDRRSARPTSSAAEAAPAAIEDLHADGIDVVLGSYGSTISAPASRDGGRQRHAVLGDRGRRHAHRRLRAGGAHVPHAADRRGARTQRDLVRRRTARRGVRARPSTICATRSRFVDDVYGRSVADGALAGGRRPRPRGGGQVRVRLPHGRLRRAGRAHRPLRAPTCCSSPPTSSTRVELRRALVRNDVDLLASIGTSSSYCMPEFGAALGDGRGRPVRLGQAQRRRDRPVDAAARRRRAAERARDAYDERWGEEMSPAALAGFSAAWALFAEVMPAAGRPLPRRRSPRPRSRPTCRWGACPTAAACGSASPAPRPPATTWPRRP